MKAKIKNVLTLIGFCMILVGGFGFMTGLFRGSMVVIENNHHQYSLNQKNGIAVDSDGNIYIGDGGTGCIQVYDSTGIFQYGFSFPTGGGGNFDFGIEQDKIHIVTARTESYFIFDKGKLVSSEKGIDYNRSKKLEKQYNMTQGTLYDISGKKYEISLFNTVRIEDKESGQVEKIHLDVPIFPLHIVVYWVIGAAGMVMIFELHRKFFLSFKKRVKSE